jgi:hypothetical protein
MSALFCLFFTGVRLQIRKYSLSVPLIVYLSLLLPTHLLLRSFVCTAPLPQQLPAILLAAR